MISFPLETTAVGERRIGRHIFGQDVARTVLTNIYGHFRQMVNLAIIFKSLANGYNYATIFKIHACINWNYIEYIIMIA